MIGRPDHPSPEPRCITKGICDIFSEMSNGLLPFKYVLQMWQFTTLYLKFKSNLLVKESSCY
jgi:hypothetical protein